MYVFYIILSPILQYWISCAPMLQTLLIPCGFYLLRVFSLLGWPFLAWLVFSL